MMPGRIGTNALLECMWKEAREGGLYTSDREEEPLRKGNARGKGQLQPELLAAVIHLPGALGRPEERAEPA